MRTVYDYMQAIETVKRGLPQEVGRILIKNEQAVLDLNRKLQLFDKGEDIFGKVAGRYKGNYEQGVFSDPAGYPKRKGEPFNFYDTSDLFRNFSFVYHSDSQTLEIFSEDNKAPMLVRKYGQLFGLNKQNQITLNDQIIRPELWDYISTYL